MNVTAPVGTVSAPERTELIKFAEMRVPWVAVAGPVAVRVVGGPRVRPIPVKLMEPAVPAVLVGPPAFPPPLLAVIPLTGKLAAPPS
jgi:hypothetical protein